MYMNRYSKSRENENNIREHYIFRILFLIMTLLITAFIFNNSLKNGEESNAQSAPIVEAVEKVLDPVDRVPTKTFNYIVRKAAHITEFTMLGLTLGGQICCTCRLAERWHKVSRWHIAIWLLAGLVIAATDEFIQRFTDRTSSITDVMIDFVGVIIGVIIVLFINRCKENYLQRKNVIKRIK